LFAVIVAGRDQSKGTGNRGCVATSPTTTTTAWLVDAQVPLVRFTIRCQDACNNEAKGLTMSVTKIIEVVGRSKESSDAAVKNALAEAGRSLRDVKALDVVSIGLRGDELDEWGALVRISFLVEDVGD